MLIQIVDCLHKLSAKLMPSQTEDTVKLVQPLLTCPDISLPQASVNIQSSRFAALSHALITLTLVVQSKSLPLK